MSLKPKIEAIIYAAENPVALDQIFQLIKESTPTENEAELKSQVRASLEELVAEYTSADHGIEVRQIAGGYRMATKPEQHDVVRAFAKSLKPPIRLSLPALETLAVIAYKQPVTVPEISEIRGVDSGGVIATLLDRKLITTAGRKAVIGRPILYKTTKEFLLRFGLKDVSELPSMEEFEKLVSESFQNDLYPAEAAPTATTESATPVDASVETTQSDAEPEKATEDSIHQS
jgi:segregation and condensation protein B